jgi:hypothetical protein
VSEFFENLNVVEDNGTDGEWQQCGFVVDLSTNTKKSVSR